MPPWCALLICLLKAPCSQLACSLTDEGRAAMGLSSPALQSVHATKDAAQHVTQWLLQCNFRPAPQTHVPFMVGNACYAMVIKDSEFNSWHLYE